MSVLTAIVAFTIIQLCISLVLVGLHLAAKTEKYISRWAAAGVLIALGSLAVTLNAGAPRYLVLILGNSAVLFGAILQWIGIRLFNGKQSDWRPWVLAAGFVACFSFIVLTGATVASRALVVTVWTTLILSLSFYEIWPRKERSASFGSTLGIVSICLLLACYIGRIVGTLIQAPSFLPGTPSSLGLLLIYLGPMAGVQLFFSSLLVLHFEKLVRDKNHQATHDSLTGILNRRAIDAAGERELEVAMRLNHSLCVAFVDIDHFKTINDNFGHDAGDEVLVKIAAVLKQNCRNIDLVGRNGGDEFCLIFPGADPNYLSKIGERLVAAVREVEFPRLGDVSISIGMTLWNSQAGKASWRALLRRADAELYKAKAAGRNQFSFVLSESSLVA